MHNYKVYLQQILKAQIKLFIKIILMNQMNYVKQYQI